MSNFAGINRSVGFAELAYLVGLIERLNCCLDQALRNSMARVDVYRYQRRWLVSVASVVLDSGTEPKKNGDAVGVTVFAEVQWVRPEAAL